MCFLRLSSDFDPKTVGEYFAVRCGGFNFFLLLFQFQPVSKAIQVLNIRAICSSIAYSLKRSTLRLYEIAMQPTVLPTLILVMLCNGNFCHNNIRDENSVAEVTFILHSLGIVVGFFFFYLISRHSQALSASACSAPCLTINILDCVLDVSFFFACTRCFVFYSISVLN